MTSDIVLLFPGQGSQKPGMAKDLVDAHPAARELFASVDRALGTPLSTLCFEGPAEELTLTHNAQPALLAHGLAVWAIVRDRVAPFVRAAAGHSLGEFTAYGAAGALTPTAAATLVRRRGELMYEAGVRRPGAMAAVLGTLSTPIDQLCERASREAAPAAISSLLISIHGDSLVEGWGGGAIVGLTGKMIGGGLGIGRFRSTSRR